METAAAIKENREREQLRRIFNRTATKLEADIKVENFSQVLIDIEFLKSKVERLEALDKMIQDLMLESDSYDEESFSIEIDTADTYKYRWHTINNQIKTGMSSKIPLDKIEDVKPARNYNLPKYELKKFDDNLKNWLAYWGQFKKIDEDHSLSGEDKYQYLLQSLKEDSNARVLVESFPPSAENYTKAIEQLKARFGREDLLIQVYVRELLSLVLNNNKKQVSIRLLYDKISTYLMSLETLGIVKRKYEIILYPLVESAIPETILIAWNRCNTDPSLGNQLTSLLNFLKNEVETEERINLARSDFNCIGTNHTLHREQISSLPTAASLVSNIKPKESGKVVNVICCFCDKSNHSSFECSRANKMSLEDKKEAIKKKGCCYICLKKGHMANKCKSFVRCLSCEKRHYVILCPEIHKKEKSGTLENVSLCARTNMTTLLQTLIVNITYQRKIKKVRVLLDSGSQRSYVKAKVVEELGLHETGIEIIGHTLFGGVDQPAKVYKCFDVLVSSLDNRFSVRINALQQSDLCGHLPKINNEKILDKLRDLNIVISDFDYTDTEISLLIGSDYLGSIIHNETVSLGNNLMAVNTKLGWTLQGPIKVQSTVNTSSTTCFSKTNLSDLWSIELLGIRDPYENKSKKDTEVEVLKTFNDNISVNAQGRYEVSLLWKEGCAGLKTNYEVAFKRLESTTKKLKSTGNLKMYDQVLQDWKKNDIIERVINDTNTGHYLPHHSVIKLSSMTTRVRPVFDASTKDNNGWTLNGCLDKGINMIELLPKLLIQFRKGAYGVISDIKQAFLQISIAEKDRDYLKFLWWENIQTCNELVVYRHKRVVFGITCSPFLLSATIMYHLSKYSEKYRKTVNKLKKSFYVDNCVASFDNVDEMNIFISESKEIMAKGMFDLRGWVTAPHRIDSIVEVPVLGMTWNTILDNLRCYVNISEARSEKITKRYVIAVAQHIFDPLGLVCIATLIPKLIMQKIWEHNIDWDHEIPEELAQEFKIWLSKAHFINQCLFPRHISIAPLEKCQTSLHIFCDASLTSFAACLFLRTKLNEQVKVQLVLAKNRVTPAKRKMSLPRLELMGALIATRLYKEVLESRLLTKCKEYKVYFWTDSAVVLSWLKRQAHWKPFVSNRVKEICSTTNRDDWYHLPGEYNPSDLPSRGCDAKKLMESR
ncbi:unnamed protein product [Parnassius mnemosyne]|uniref:CCHC-type domain-containing protein n=1 Tax=Parnassius mnemosyne TaxID=213953 RepID=A0AAV1M611_9NEOP